MAEECTRWKREASCSHEGVLVLRVLVSGSPPCLSCYLLLSQLLMVGLVCFLFGSTIGTGAAGNA